MMEAGDTEDFRGRAVHNGSEEVEEEKEVSIDPLNINKTRETNETEDSSTNGTQLAGNGVVEKGEELKELKFFKDKW